MTVKKEPPPISTMLGPHFHRDSLVLMVYPDLPETERKPVPGMQEYVGTWCGIDTYIDNSLPDGIAGKLLRKVDVIDVQKGST